MVEEPSHVKQLSLNHVCKIGLRKCSAKRIKVVNDGEKGKLSLRSIFIIAIKRKIFMLRFYKEAKIKTKARKKGLNLCTTLQRYL